MFSNLNSSSQHPPAIPWLLFTLNCHQQTQPIRLITLQPHPTNDHPIPIPHSSCIAAQHGWLLLHDPSRCFSLWNSISLETIHLPPLETKYLSEVLNQYICVLSSPPTEPNCMVVFINKTTRDSLRFIYCRPRDEKWTVQKIGESGSVSLMLNRDSFKCAVGCPHDGTIYALTRDNTFVAVRRNFSRFLDIDLVLGFGQTVMSFMGYGDVTLVESCGEIFLVGKIWSESRYGGREVECIEVFKMDFAEREWVKVESLGGDLLFLLGKNCSCSCYTAELGLKGNCIYFTVENDQSLQVFDLEDNSVSIFLPFPNLPTAYLSCGWLLPLQRIMVFPNKVARNENLEEIHQADARMDGQTQNSEGDWRDWANLPYELLKLISRQMLLVDYMHFNGVCKAWREVAPLTEWSTTLIDFTPSYPWLLSVEDEKGRCRFFDPIFNEIYCMNIPNISGAIIRSARNGWLLMSRLPNFMFFFNPFTKATIKLPRLGSDVLQAISFYASPTSSDCMVFGVSNSSQFTTIGLCCRGDESWSFFHINNNLGSLGPFSNPVFYNGSFYCLCEAGYVGIFDPYETEWTTIGKPLESCPSQYEEYLVECNAELLLAFVGHLGKWVKVFGLNHSMMKWAEKNVSEEHTFFVSSIASLSVEPLVQKPETGNKVYFPRLRANSCIFYSLESGRLHVKGSDDCLVDFYGTRRPLHCAWVQPRWLQPFGEALDWHVKY